MAKRSDSRRTSPRRQSAERNRAASEARGTVPKSAAIQHNLGWPAVSRLELLTLLAIVLVAAGLRLNDFSHIAVEHFDEGVYTSSLWFSSDDGHEYPDRHLYAPPLFPWVVEQASLFGVILADGPQTGAVLVNIAAGVLTVVGMWCVGRCWFSPAAGLVSALLAAVSGFHLLYSRTVLTDTMLGLWLLSAVAVLPAALAANSRASIVVGGVLTGLAWWTKYNGWLPLAIAAAGLAAWQSERAVLQLRHRLHDGEPPAGWKQTGREWLRWLAIATVAVLVWSPVWWSLQDRGGYAAVAANHRQYLVGFSGWWASLGRQAAAQQFFSGWTDSLGIGLAVLVAGWFHSRQFAAAPAMQGETAAAAAGRASATAVPAARYWLPVATTATGLALVTGVCGSGLVLAVLALVELTRRVLSRWSTSRKEVPTAVPQAMQNRETSTGSVPIEPAAESSAANSRLKLWLLLAWFVGLLLVTPLYRPYPRLTLPWLISSWLAAGTAVVTLPRWLCSSPALWGHPGVQSAIHKVASHQAHPAPAVQISRSRTPLIVWSGSLLTLIAVFCSLALLPSDSRLIRPMSAWQSRTGFAQISRDILADASAVVVHGGSPAAGPVRMAVYVIGEPGLFYQLARRGDEAAALIHPLGDLRFAAPDAQALPIPLFAVLGPHALRDPGVQDQLARFKARLLPVGRYEYQPSDLVDLNSHRPPAMSGGRHEPREVRLYHLLDRPRADALPARQAQLPRPGS